MLQHFHKKLMPQQNFEGRVVIHDRTLPRVALPLGGSAIPKRSTTQMEVN